MTVSKSQNFSKLTVVKSKNCQKWKYFTYFISLSHLFPAITIGTFGITFFTLVPCVCGRDALYFVSRICSLSLCTSSNDSRESILNTNTKMSPKSKGEKTKNKNPLFNLNTLTNFLVLSNSLQNMSKLSHLLVFNQKQRTQITISNLKSISQTSLTDIKPDASSRSTFSHLLTWHVYLLIPLVH